MISESQHASDSACTYGVAALCYLAAKMAEYAAFAQNLIIYVSLLIALLRLCHDARHYYIKWKLRRRGDDTPPPPSIE